MCLPAGAESWLVPSDGAGTGDKADGSVGNCVDVRDSGCSDGGDGKGESRNDGGGKRDHVDKLGWDDR